MSIGTPKDRIALETLKKLTGVDWENRKFTSQIQATQPGRKEYILKSPVSDIAAAKMAMVEFGVDKDSLGTAYSRTKAQGNIKKISIDSKAITQELVDMVNKECRVEPKVQLPMVEQGKSI